MNTTIKNYNQAQMSFRALIFDAAVQNYSGLFITKFKSRALFVRKAYQNKNAIDAFAERLSHLPNGVVVDIKPEMLGVINWPYIHNEWDLDTKFEKILTHYEILSALNSSLVHVGGSATDADADCHDLMDLSDFSPDLKVMIDKAPWFTREGELLINLIRGGLRAASIAFTLGKANGETVAYIGAIQGMHSGLSVDEALEIYKGLTKDFHGLRPRSLLLEVLKVLLKKLGVTRIYAVSDRNRHHRHVYFGNDENTVFKNDYNLIWEEHDGVLNPEIGFYEIPIAPAIKDMAEIPSKKRSLYKKRYEVIHALNDRVKLEKSA